ncbi:hypothetical protein LINPERPRIM_LOCUS3240 [Linum perenne]
MTLRVIKGDVLQKYTTYVSKAVIVDGGGQVTWYVEYEKADPTLKKKLSFSYFSYRRHINAVAITNY